MRMVVCVNPKAEEYDETLVSFSKIYQAHVVLIIFFTFYVKNIFVTFSSITDFGTGLTKMLQAWYVA